MRPRPQVGNNKIKSESQSFGNAKLTLKIIKLLRIVMFDVEENSWSGGHHAQLTEVFRPYRHYNLKLLYVWKGAVPGPEKRKSDILSLLSMGKG